MRASRDTVSLDREVRNRRSIRGYRNGINAGFTSIVAILFAAALMTVVFPASEAPKAPDAPQTIGAYYVNHPKIFINGDAEFSGSNATTGISTGSGTASDPYIIQGWYIDTPIDDGIKIWSTDKHFVIRNCYISNSQFSAIGFYDVHNGSIVNCVAYNNDYGGIFISTSSDVTLSDTSVISNRHEGLYILGCVGVSISKVNCSDNDDDNLLISGSSTCTVISSNFSGKSNGIHLSSSVSCTLTSNSFFGTGLFISGANLNQWDTHSIGLTNRVNGKLLVYVKDTVGGKAPSGSGQVILANCSGTIIENETLSNTSAGIILGFCSDIPITNNTLSDISQGIDVFSSVNNTLSNNTISRSGEYGVMLDSSIGNLLKNNTMASSGIVMAGSDIGHWTTHLIDTSNTVNGRAVRYYKNATGITIPAGAGQVILANCTEMTVRDQNLTRTCIGLQVAFSSNNTLLNNNCSSESEWGMDLWFSDNNTVADNACCLIKNYPYYYYGDDYGIILQYSDNNTLIGNNCSDNGYLGMNIADSCGNAISYNFLSKNFMYGIRFAAHSENNTVWNNTFYHNFGGSESYSIYHIQAADSGANNRWNTSNGYGNWWSDLTGPDNLPPYGIVDWPYNVSGYDSKDYYPLTSLPVPPIIPEFSDIAVPIIGLALIVLVFRSARARKE